MSEKVNDLRWQILHYLRRNPRAAETAGGVNRVWLHRPPILDAVAEVEQALHELVLAGEMERHDLPGGEKVYRGAEHRKSS